LLVCRPTGPPPKPRGKGQCQAVSSRCSPPSCAAASRGRTPLLAGLPSLTPPLSSPLAPCSGTGTAVHGTRPDTGLTRLARHTVLPCPHNPSQPPRHRGHLLAQLRNPPTLSRLATYKPTLRGGTAATPPPLQGGGPQPQPPSLFRFGPLNPWSHCVPHHTSYHGIEPPHIPIFLLISCTAVYTSTHPARRTFTVRARARRICDCSHAPVPRMANPAPPCLCLLLTSALPRPSSALALSSATFAHSPACSSPPGGPCKRAAGSPGRPPATAPLPARQPSHPPVRPSTRREQPGGSRTPP
jgi:hypothetical protein